MQTNSSVLSSNTKIVLEYDKWVVKELGLTPQKIEELWKMMRNFSTLFSDTTRGNYNDWLNSLINPYDYWLEIYEDGAPIGLIHFENMQHVLDCQIHAIIYDRRVAARVDIFKELVKYMFSTFPLLERISAQIPRGYIVPIRAVRRIGFRQEGYQQNMVLLKGKPDDVILFRILRAEAFNGVPDRKHKDVRSDSGTDSGSEGRSGELHHGGNA